MLTVDEAEDLAAPGGPAGDPPRITPVPRGPHWAVAVLGVTVLFAGAAVVASLADRRLPIAPHSSLSTVVLLLVVLLLVNRCTYRAPVPPRSMSPAGRRAAAMSESLLHGLLLTQPLIGWAMASASGAPLELDALVRLPAIAPEDPVLFAALRETHPVFAYALLLLFVAHTSAVLVHASTGPERRQDGPVTPSGRPLGLRADGGRRGWYTQSRYGAAQASGTREPFAARGHASRQHPRRRT
ncbi:cytochrome b/b6 domain-containing protein [Streptomyces sp. P5-A9]|uniref:cytochrome b/b6 domain-containing protein n=1 Tax=Streptomyces sp. P5-A9 TaxID=3071730 RepID=UPI002FC714BC